jgi:hypothetical protein
VIAKSGGALRSRKSLIHRSRWNTTHQHSGDDTDKKDRFDDSVPENRRYLVHPLPHLVSKNLSRHRPQTVSGVCSQELKDPHPQREFVPFEWNPSELLLG